MAELRFALGDWSSQWLRLRKATKDSTTQSRLRCDLAQKLYFKECATEVLFEATPEERLWKKVLSTRDAEQLIQLLPHPSLGWSSPHRENVFFEKDTMDLHRQAHILYGISAPLEPWLNRLWKRYQATLPFLVSLGFLGLSYPTAIPHSIRAILCAAECSQHSIWPLLHARYKAELNHQQEATQILQKIATPNTKIGFALKIDTLRRLGFSAPKNDEDSFEGILKKVKSALCTPKVLGSGM